MNVAFDLDGTIDADPAFFQSLMAALKAAGHTVYVLTGVSQPTATAQDAADKKQYLSSIGCANCYDRLIVVGKPHPENKAQAVKQNDIAALFDNDKKTAKAVSAEATVLVPWATRQ